MPPSASSNLPLRGGDRAGEGALFVAEQLAFEKLGGDGGAVHLDEWSGGERDFRDGCARPAIPCRFRTRP